ncbi:P-loop containing nucleoside triphosphate hydrolase protein [Lipomyces japonicus]|uniref:P-loop containing nucleoside triphosphate hydrolase protein n=1 Tax=Lipomyces japonicus TaxID=56871 RepID=UPI0034CDF24B
MLSFSCPDSVWMGDDFSQCFREKYLQVRFPVFVVIFSVVIISATVSPWSVQRIFSKSTTSGGDSDQQLRQFHDEELENIDSNYQLETNAETALQSQEDEFVLFDGSFELRPVKQTSFRANATLEQILVIFMILFHGALLVALSLYDRLEINVKSSLISVFYWFYLLLLIVYKNAARLTSVPPSIWIHGIILYFYILINYGLELRSVLGHFRSYTANTIASVDFVVTLTVFIVILVSPVGRPPLYIKVSTGVNPYPEPFASLISRLTFSWVAEIINKGLKHPLEYEDVWEVKEEHKAAKVTNEYRQARGSLSFQKGLFWFVWKDAVIANIDTVIYGLLNCVPALLIRSILKYMEHPDEQPRHMAWLYVTLVAISTLLYSIFNARSFWGFKYLSLKIRSVLMSEIYDTALKRHLTPANQNDSSDVMSIGAIINLMTTDSNTIAENVANANTVVYGSTSIIIALILLVQNLGKSAYVGIFIILSMMPLNYYISKKFGRLTANILNHSDRRVQRTKEALQSIKIIKYFAWEQMFTNELLGIRSKELKEIRKFFALQAVTVIVWYGFPTMVTVVTFGLYTRIEKKELTSSVAFSSLALFNQLREPLELLSDIITVWVNTKISLNRIVKFMSEEPTEKYHQMASATRDPSSPHIGFEDASFAWESSSDDTTAFQLHSLNVHFNVGELTVIVGPTGCGKTSLLLALLGEMRLLKGRVFIPGKAHFGVPKINTDGFSDSIAYCAQQAWLLNDTIRSNILFGLEYDRERYQAVIDCCALRKDLEILDAQDLTEVGEKGIALSGGQKQRISLARAVYSRAKHLLLDDCLSAVDSHSALWIYEKCIAGPLMAGRTCILVSHNVALTLTAAKYVIVMSQGRITAHGGTREVYESGAIPKEETLEQALFGPTIKPSTSAAADTETNILSKNAANIVDRETDNNNNDDDDDEVEASKEPQNINVSHALVERGATGALSFSVYAAYLKSMGGNYFWIVLLVAFLIHQLGLVTQSWWIREWTHSTAVPTGHDDGYYMTIYAVISAFYIFLSFLRSVIVFWGSITASRNMYANLLSTIFRASPRFFDQTPVGRLLNRFSKDVQDMDRRVAPRLLLFAHSAFSLAISLFLIISVIPSFALGAVAMCVAFYFVVHDFSVPTRELRRLKAALYSPIYQHFGETLNGLSTIRAYGYEKQFIDKNTISIDRSARPNLAESACVRWMAFRVETIAGIGSALAAAMIMGSSDRIDSSLAGLCLTYAITFLDSMLWFVLWYIMVDLDMNSVERIREYLQIPPEAPQVILETQPARSWPERGTIKVANLSLRYAPDLPLVIHDVSFSASPGSKIGIVGRTGAGKSTIAAAFFRFLEADRGSIVIDGVDISTIGLQTLREALTIIPQDPTLFSGTIRSNLDPFGQYHDSAISEALCRVHLVRNGESGTTSAASSTFENVFQNLDSPIVEGGGNISQGQRQLMCLARSLLKSPKVIILDEAMASVDYYTDELLQKTIRDEFSNMTILTIAHRLRSIIDYDKILVLDAGTVKEFDAPHLLLQQKDSLFRSMCQTSGELATLEELALQSYLNHQG